MEIKLCKKVTSKLENPRKQSKETDSKMRFWSLYTLGAGNTHPITSSITVTLAYHIVQYLNVLKQKNSKVGWNIKERE